MHAIAAQIAFDSGATLAGATAALVAQSHQDCLGLQVGSGVAWARKVSMWYPHNTTTQLEPTLQLERGPASHFSARIDRIARPCIQL